MLNPLVPTFGDVALGVIVILAPLLLTAFVVVVVVTNVRRSRAVAAPDPERSAESRLTEAQDLYRRGLVTADELGELRQRILGEL